MYLYLYLSQKWKRLYALFHPRPVIDKAEVGPRCLVHGPILAYGWAFARADLMKYAEFHKISMPLLGYLGAKLGKPYVRYGALEGNDTQDEELLYFLGKCAWMAVRKHLEQESGVKLLYLLPFSQAHDVMFAVYMNGEAERRIEEIDATVGLDDALDAIEFAISDAGVQSELLWWYDRAGLWTVVRK